MRRQVPNLSPYEFLKSGEGSENWTGTGVGPVAPARDLYAAAT